MFKQNGEYISNKDNEFLKNSDLVIGWNNQKGEINFEGDEKLAMLFARLSYVFGLVDDELKKREDYEEFIDILSGIRIKKTLERNNLTLAEVAEFLSKLDENRQISFVIDEDDYDTIRFLIGFSAMIGLEKVGLYFSELDEEFNEFRLVD